ncbi:MAG TPA: T9SS type A sorting domain-containing protein [Chitinophagales bacterium]|nr:T9SS type A sorting domain-containing protein [Chitinophagales bacterium]
MSLLTAGLFSNAQQQYSHKDNKALRLVERPVVMQGSHTPANTTPRPQHRDSRSLGTVLNSQRIGSAGNLLSVIDGGCNQIDVNDSLNAVVFIHRNDNTLIPATGNVAQYRYDISKNRGATWLTDIGPITNDPSIDNQDVCGRFPQAVIYNRPGNTNVDSAYLVYSGTWHDNNTWSGQMRGRGKLSGQIPSFNVHIDPINNKEVAIATGMCKGAPGVFWNVNAAYNGTFTAGADAITSGLIIQKGVWNTNTKDVDWTDQLITQSFVDQDNGGATVSAATSFQIAFDPTGQYGWVSILGDITADNDSTYNPIFWKTTDGGANWTGPIVVDLKLVQGVVGALNPTIITGDPASLNPTTAFESDLTVDVNGNPHLLTTVGSGSEYSIQTAGYTVWDITYDAGAIAGCNWKGVRLADIGTLRGTFTNENPGQTMDNRPIISRSEDAHKIFFFWLETDYTVHADPLDRANDSPDLFARAIDVVDETMTDVINLTTTDTLWSGYSANSEVGVFGGALFPVVSQTALKNGNTYNVPLVLTQPDYNHDPTLGLGSSEAPAAFWYVDNVNFAAGDFSQNLDQVAPTITLNGPDTVTVLLNGTYTEDGATAFDCTDGVITPVIQNAPNTAVGDIYEVLYIATDAAGNSDTVTRVVIVGAIPVADFTFNTPQLGYKVQFTDASSYNPYAWVWSFGDGGGSLNQNPLKTYTTNAVFNVCLTATNSFGTSPQVCKDVTVFGVGINDPELEQQISMFPNPTNGKVSINFQGDVTRQMTVSVYNMLGEVVVNPTTYKAGTTNMTFDVSNVANGVYLVKIQNDKSTAIKQLTVNHK